MSDDQAVDEIWAVALHGGAGVDPTRSYDRALAHLDELVRWCAEALKRGTSALDVVEHAVAEMEASGLYVAGRGSAPNSAGRFELDAAIMDGAHRRAGAIAAATDVASPVRVARRVMERTANVLLCGEGARAFALAQGFVPVVSTEGYYVLPDGVEPEDLAGARAHGTVGAVARDRAGRLAAATSTGGLFGKQPGRVGDTPLIGAGTWADDRVAISCTGVGESFILAGGAHDVAARMRYGGAALKAALEAMLSQVEALGGDGGAITVTREGEIASACNSAGMKRAAASYKVAPFASL